MTSLPKCQSPHECVFLPWVAKYTNIGFNDDDVAALISSIDSSQDASLPSQLPAELLLQVLESVPIDYVLDWRLVCRGFRDAIDGRVLHHHLQRADVVGYMGSRHCRAMDNVDETQYEQIHLLKAWFHGMDRSKDGSERKGPAWKRSHAIFHIDESWFSAFREIGGAAADNGHTVEGAHVTWLPTLDRLELRREEEGYGTLRWCLQLDHAVLDLDFPLEKGRSIFDMEVNLHERTIRVGWRPMLFNFLKTERALQHKLREKESKYTFSHAEDCLRSIRRQRLHARLDLDNRIDRHIKWSLRLLSPLFGKTHHDISTALSDVEDDAINILLLLRREAAMSPRQIAHLHQLSADYHTMQQEIAELEEAFDQFKSHLTMSGFELSIALPTLHPMRVARNPIAWPDDLRAKIEELVARWKSQKKVIEQMQEILTASNIALAVPDNSFDDLGSDF